MKADDVFDIVTQRGVSRQSGIDCIESYANSKIIKTLDEMQKKTEASNEVLRGCMEKLDRLMEMTKHPRGVA